MANDNHLLSVTCYNVTMQNNNYYNDKYYTEFFELGQQKINFKLFRQGKNRVQSNYDVCCSYLRKHAWGKGC